MALAETTRALAGRSEAAQLAVLHHCLAHPVDLGVTTDGLVRRIGQNHLEEFVRGVLAYPVGVEHAQSAAAATHTLLI